MDPSYLIVGYAAAVLIGVTLGLVGGGGSILTVPVLVYLLGVDEERSTAYSLFVVGASALFGSAQYLRRGMVDLKTAFAFGAPSVATVFLTRFLILPALPDMLVDVGPVSLTKPAAMMSFLAVLMLASSYKMIASGDLPEGEGAGGSSGALALRGAVVGVVAGLVGAGGGFLIVPALALLAGLPMKRAVAASLTIIAAQSLIGFLGDVFIREIEWDFLLPFTAFSVGGIFLGGYLSRFVSGERLKPAFGWFVLLMSVYILGKELLF